MINIWSFVSIYFIIVAVFSFVLGLYDDDEVLIISASLFWPFTVVVLAGVGILYLIRVPFKLARHVDKRLTPKKQRSKADER